MELALDKKGMDVAILDMKDLVDYTDVFVLITGRNRRHVAALAEDLRTYAKNELGLKCEGIEGQAAARWVLVDFGSVVVAGFSERTRKLGGAGRVSPLRAQFVRARSGPVEQTSCTSRGPSAGTRSRR